MRVLGNRVMIQDTEFRIDVVSTDFQAIDVGDGVNGRIDADLHSNFVPVRERRRHQRDPIAQGALAAPDRQRVPRHRRQPRRHVPFRGGVRERGARHDQREQFLDLGSPATPAEAMITSDADIEGHHFAISGDLFEQCVAASILLLRGGRFGAITGNVLGRRLICTAGAVRIENSTGGFEGSSNSITGSEFHNVTLSISIAMGDHTSITENPFTLGQGRPIEVGVKTRGASIVGNPFVTAPRIGPNVPEAVLLQGVDHLVHDNVVPQESPFFGFTNFISNPSSDANVLDTWKS